MPTTWHQPVKRAKALLYLDCFIVTWLQIANDSLAQSFLLSYKTFDDRRVAYRNERVQQQALSLMNDIQKVHEILELFTDYDI